MMNPVLAREIRTRVRDWRSPLLIVGYVASLGAVVLLYFSSQLPSLLSGHLFGPELGLNVYNLLAFFQLLLISFIIPAISAGAICGEKERQTFDLLWCTRLTARSIVLGKLAASIAYLLLVVVATIPLYSLIFLFGGLAPGALLLTLAVYIFTGLLFAAVSIFCSSITNRTTVATVLAYALVFFLLVGTVVAAAVEWHVISRQPPDPARPWRMPPKVLYLNPLVAMLSVLPGNNVRIPIPYIYMSSFGSLRPVLVYHGATPPPPPPKVAPAWQYNFALDILLVTLLVCLSILLIDPMGPVSRLHAVWTRHRKAVR